MSSHQQAHNAHTDIRVPDMAKNARWSELNGPSAEDTSYGRLVFSYSVLGMGGMSLVVGGKQVVTNLLDMKNPSAAAWATSKTEVDIGKIAEGLLKLYCCVHHIDLESMWVGDQLICACYRKQGN